MAPAGARTEEKLEYLEKQWALADTNGAHMLNETKGQKPYSAYLSLLLSALLL